MALIRYTAVFSEILRSAGLTTTCRTAVVTPTSHGCRWMKQCSPIAKRDSRLSVVDACALPEDSTLAVETSERLESSGKGCPSSGRRWVSSPLHVFGSSRLPSSVEQCFDHLSINRNMFLNEQQRCFSTRNIRGRLFYRRRPKMIPRYKPKNRRSCWLEGCPQKKGVCVSIRVVTPRKPNSGLRKVARVRLSTGRTVTCHVPGEGHNLHTHSVVLVRGGRCQDVSGCHYKVIRGKYDLLPVKNRASSRSKYGVRLSDAVVEKRRIRMNQLHITTDLDREIFNRLLLHDWVRPDGSRRTDPVGPDEPVDVDIFTFNSRLRSIVHANKGS
ncbi:putative ribosomal protein S12 [Babesia divergens]|uniref:Ribosomal protein S12, mitochondrial n=1 Tax=Babesia divergens TaxID=32595 RepID=A0AAD9GJ78_BABDI|nr:putative ribosomal protein S12 [Babesia divergens]